MNKEWLGFIVLPAAVVAFFGGMSMVSAGRPLGWLGLAGGVLLAITAYRVMAGRRADAAPEESAPSEPAESQQGVTVSDAEH